GGVTLAPQSGERVARAQRGPGEGQQSRDADPTCGWCMRLPLTRLAAFAARHPLPAPLRFAGRVSVRGGANVPLTIAANLIYASSQSGVKLNGPASDGYGRGRRRPSGNPWEGGIMLKSKMTRRRFLAATSTAVIAMPYVRGAHAAGRLSIGFWDHWVPGANNASKTLCEEWAAKEKVE